MQSDRWQSCTAIFNAAVEGPRAGRAALLARSCNGDAPLRRKVELLLKYHDEAGDFIESPAFEVAPEFLVDDAEALIGQHLGSYRIDAILGAGGMGVVYLAFDERLERKVALKLLPQSLLAKEARFEQLKREARTASALNHPNIMTIHEVGEVDSTHYIATEFIDGITLRERMVKGAIPPNEALDIATQVASALCVAHRAGIVHRDIKPENIMLRPDGYVKVLDFGIAKFTQQEKLTARTSAGVLVTTQQGKMLGTARYMSPEQARGDTVDARSDLWSLGVVLYEMLAGLPPFGGETPTDVIAAVLLKEPEPVEQHAPVVPASVQQVVEKSLRKDPAERYQTADELLDDLHALDEQPDRVSPGRIAGLSWSQQSARWIGIAAVVTGILSIAVIYGWRERGRATALAPVEKGLAVLPFENLGADKNDAFFAAAMQDDVLTSVGKIKDLKVIARSSVMDYRGARVAGHIREIGQTLGVSHVLEGSVRRVADRVVMNLALIDTRDERQVWSQHYERTMSEAMSLQGDLAMDIARALHATLTLAETTFAAATPTQNPEAYLLYLRAREIEIGSYSADQVQGAIGLYQQAVDLDPNFALARARLSLCASRWVYSDGPPEWKAKARTEAEEALRLRPDLGEARLALTHCYLWGDRDYDRALAELARTAETLPNSAEVPLTAAFIYKQQNRYRERFAALRRAETLDPRNAKVLGYLTNTLEWVRDWPEALQTFDRVAALGRDDSTHGWWWSRANDEFQLTGDINALKKAITKKADGPPSVSSGWLNQARYEMAMLERDYTEAARFLAAVPPETFREVSGWYGHSKAFDRALVDVAGNMDAAAKQQALEQALELARGEYATRLSSGAHGRPDDEKIQGDIALLYAFLGRKEEAIREALRAVEVASVVGELEKNELSSALAMVYAHTGEPEKAIDLIERLLTEPSILQHGAVYNMTLTDLKWRWQWDPLRNNPRFQKILAGPEPKTVY